MKEKVSSDHVAYLLNLFLIEKNPYFNYEDIKFVIKTFVSVRDIDLPVSEKIKNIIHEAIVNHKIKEEDKVFFIELCHSIG